MKQDIVPFVQNGNLPFGLSGAQSAPLRARYLSLLAFLSGQISFRTFFPMLLPVHWFSKEKQRGIWAVFNGFLRHYNRRALREYLDKEGTLNVLGNRFMVPLETYGDVVSLIQQIFVADQYDARRFLRPDSVVIDAGANVGLFSIFAARLAGKVLAFEPTPITFAALKENVRPYPNITVIHGGLGEQRTTRSFLIFPDTTAGNHFEGIPGNVDHNVPLATLSIPIRTIDEVMKGARVDFIKIDTEGYEGNILRGAAATIRKWRPVISMSAYHKAEDPVELPALLRAIYPGYVCELHEEEEKDLICYVPPGRN